MIKLNNKGYLLVEIILASVLAIGMGYFMTQITIKTKNRNDDLLVTSLVSTDQGIIYNGIMKKILSNPPATLNELKEKITIDDKKISYDNELLTELTKYATFKSIIKDEDSNAIIIPIEVKQLPDNNFDVIIYLD